MPKQDLPHGESYKDISVSTGDTPHLVEKHTLGLNKHLIDQTESETAAVKVEVSQEARFQSLASEWEKKSFLPAAASPTVMQVRVKGRSWTRPYEGGDAVQLFGVSGATARRFIVPVRAPSSGGSSSPQGLVLWLSEDQQDDVDETRDLTSLPPSRTWRKSP